jgi:alkyl hydroperoxide reductase subunit AhpC
MNELFKEVNKKSPKSLSAKIINAYYQPINPDWKQPDPWRDSIIAAHYFDYFNPADSFYLHTNILPEKMDIFLTLSTNKRDAYGQPVRDEMLAAIAAQEFLEKVKNNKENFEFCLKFLLKELDKEKQFIALLTIYDLYVKPEDSSCEPTNTQFDWIRKKADILKNIQIGSIAPDFEISTVESINYPIGFEKETLRLSSLQSDYTLLLFWATWCKHCTQVLPEIKKAADEFNMKQETANLKLITVAVSLDTDNAQWRKFVTENNLLSFLNFSELKGWKGKVSKQYNVYATPTMFLLDKDKKIIFQPLTINELILNLEEICKKANAIH